MALGGVEIGIMKPMEAPSVAPGAGWRGSIPAACDTAMAIGTIMLAEAVLDAASDMTIATAVKRIVSDASDWMGSHDVMPRPIDSARPVEKASSPIARPPPNS